METTRFSETALQELNDFHADGLMAVARAFKCDSAQIEAKESPDCENENLSHFSIVLGNGQSLSLGTHANDAMESINNSIDHALEWHNPKNIEENMRRAMTALMDREVRDNELALENGLKPYMLLGVEFITGVVNFTPSVNQFYDPIGRYCIAMAVDNKIFGFTDSHLNYEIALSSFDKDNRFDHSPYGQKDTDIDFVFNSQGHSLRKNLGEIALSDEAMLRAERMLAVRNAFNSAIKNLETNLKQFLESRERCLGETAPYEFKCGGYGFPGSDIIIWNTANASPAAYIRAENGAYSNHSIEIHDGKMPADIKGALYSSMLTAITSIRHADEWHAPAPEAFEPGLEDEFEDDLEA